MKPAVTHKCGKCDEPGRLFRMSYAGSGYQFRLCLEHARDAADKFTGSGMSAQFAEEARAYLRGKLYPRGLVG